MKTDNRIIAILACLRGGVAGIYAQKKLDELDKELETQDWDDSIKKSRQCSVTRQRQQILNGRLKPLSKRNKTQQTL